MGSPTVHKSMLLRLFPIVHWGRGETNLVLVAAPGNEMSSGKINGKQVEIIRASHWAEARCTLSRGPMKKVFQISKE